MNSLVFISRQFDSLSAKTPPSTPVEEFEPNDAPTRAWSTKSFLLPQPRRLVLHSRSRSSPAEFIKLSAPPPPIRVVLTPDSHSHARLLMRTPSPPVESPSSARIYIVRVLALIWHALWAAWTSLSSIRMPDRRREPTPADPGSPLDSDTDLSDDESVPSSSKTPSPSPSPPPALPDPPLDAPSRTDSLFTLEPPTNGRSHTRHTSLPPVSIALPPAPPLSQARVSVSRELTPTEGAPVARKITPFHVQKTLVLDLDETLIHSTSRPVYLPSSGSFFLSPFGRRNTGSGHIVEVNLSGRSTLYHVYKRPFVDFFLRTVSTWYTLVIFTASMQEYADPVIDWLDAGRGILERRLFRDSCTQLPNGSYTKDLSLVDLDLSRVCLVDNSPVSYRVNEANGIPIEGWTHDPYDEALLDLLPVLDSLRFTSDVRRVLGLRIAGGSAHS